GAGGAGDTGARETLLQAVAALAPWQLAPVAASSAEGSAAGSMALADPPSGMAGTAARVVTLAGRLGGGFRRKILLLVAGRILRRLLLPAPLRVAYTVFQALRLWRRGLAVLAKGRLNVDVLDASAVAAAMLQGDADAASSIIFLLRLSELLEERALYKTRALLSDSLRFRADTAWISEGGCERQIPAKDLIPGMLVVVRTGGMIPVDGEVHEGEAVVGEAAMTGEPLGVFKKPGSSVFAGTVVEDGTLLVRARATEDETRIRHILRVVEESEGFKADIQSRANSFADRLVPYSFLAAGLVFAVTRDLNKALSILLVDYSCAIRLSTSIAFLAAMREASEAGATVKGGRFLEALAHADTFVFDKTGTLTEASPRVSGVCAFAPYSREEVLRLSACIEEHFPHSAARAITDAAKAEGLRHEEEHADVEYIVAHGIATTIHGRRAVIGSRHFVFEDEGATYDAAQAARMDAEEDSLICLAVDGKLAGYITIHDPPREDAADAIRALRGLGVRNIVMLTGDSEAAAKRVSEALGLDSYRAQTLPEQKGEIIASMRAAGHTVIMVGDGVNDSPALAAADASIAMNGASALARDVADIMLTDSGLMQLAMLRRLALSLMRRIRSGYFFIGGFNSALIALGLAGVVSPGNSALLHNLSTVGVSAASARRCVTEKP
ncbi:MAG: heavy metal translocating P-type ATPase, partial [Clostridiales Family XIII bacterium]|nr:heavy metal translocating P-type ATPase [Clostridiales Family XIII bacterium]